MESLAVSPTSATPDFIPNPSAVSVSQRCHFNQLIWNRLLNTSEAICLTDLLPSPKGR